jgi:uncharacterized protein (DUF58 family)
MKAQLSRDSPTARNREMAVLVEQVRLPFHSRAWRGSAGAWQGLNQGSSVDFQDHRGYVPGDDPRHLDWAAYARTNHYTMKLFREEISPRLDLALDVSRSMALTPEKEARGLELFGLVLRLALRDGISARVYALEGAGHWRRMEIPVALELQHLPEFSRARGEPSPGSRWLPTDSEGQRLPLAEIPWRSGSMRVLISDLLLPQAPGPELSRLGRDQGRVVILAPYLQAEMEPGWQGNLELHDCETQAVRQQRVEPFLLERYRKSYLRHFELWREEARKRSVPLARISSELSLGAAVRQQALPAGVFEGRH